MWKTLIILWKNQQYEIFSEYKYLVDTSLMMLKSNEWRFISRIKFYIKFYSVL